MSSQTTVRTIGHARVRTQATPNAQRWNNQRLVLRKNSPKTETHRSFPHAERQSIRTRKRSLRDQSSVSLSDANGRNNTDSDQNPSTVAHGILFSFKKILPSSPIAPNQHGTVSFSRSKLDTQAGSRRMVSLPRPRTQSHVTLASAATPGVQETTTAIATVSAFLLRSAVARLAVPAQCSYGRLDAAGFACPTYTSGCYGGCVLTTFSQPFPPSNF